MKRRRAAAATTAFVLLTLRPTRTIRPWLLRPVAPLVVRTIVQENLHGRIRLPAMTCAKPSVVNELRAGGPALHREARMEAASRSIVRRQQCLLEKLCDQTA